MRRRALAAFLILLALPFAARAHNHKLLWGNLSEKTRQAILQKVPILQTDHWTYEDLDKLIQALVADEQYDSVRLVKQEDGDVQVVVGKIRRISTLEFQGNSAISDAELRRETGLNEKTAFDPSFLIEAGEHIRRRYETLGFPKTQVDLKYTDASPTEVAVTVIVREGPQTLMDEFQVDTPNGDLRRLLMKTLRRWKDEPLTDKSLAELRGRVREKLSANGYWRTELSDPVIKRDFEEKKASLAFHIEHSDQYIFETDGAYRISHSKLMSRLALDSYYSANPNIAGEIGGRVRALYLSEGYARVEVSTEEKESIQPYVKRIIVKVNEGPHVKIEKIEFSGVLSQPQEHYVDFLKSHSSATVDDGYYVKDDIDQGLKNLVTDLWNQGFLRAKLVSTRTLYNKDRDRVTLSISLDEGPLTQVQKITFEGNTQIPEADLLKVVQLEEGKPLRLTALDGAVVLLKQYYRDHGFLEMSLENEKEGLVTYNEDNSLVHLNFKIVEGPQVRVASILIEGNSLTRDYVIMKELEFKKGDILTPQAIDESTARLQRLGFFSAIEIKTLEEHTQISDRTVVVKVNDRDPGLFNFGAGVTNENGVTVRGYTGVAYRNILGTGRGASARADGNYNITNIHFLENKVALGYLEPYIFDTRTRGRVNITRSTQVTDQDSTRAENINQFTYSFEQDVTSHFLAIWDVWAFAHVEDFYIDPPAGTKGNISDINLGWTALTFDFDYRDHPFNPTHGNFTRLNAEYGCPTLLGSPEVEYLRYFGSYTHYTPVNSKHNVVWANSVRIGHVRNISDRDNGFLPYDKKGFQLGGQTTIRGFSASEAFPNYKDFGVDTIDQDMKLFGSATMELFKTELRFPIYGNVGGAFFYDGGQILLYGDNKLTQDQLEGIEGWRQSVGWALRYLTPVGAISAEIGYKLPARHSRVTDESWTSFFISIGTF